MLEANGYRVETVEQIKRIPGRTWRVDLFGVFDLLCVNEAGNIQAIQVTSRANVQNRVKKIANEPVIDWLRKAEWGMFVWGYGKTKTKGDWMIVDVS